MIPFIDSILEPFIWFLTDWSLRWAVLIGLLAACLLIFRPRRASTRSLLCWVILLAGLLLPALPRWGPGFAGPAPALQARSPEGEPMESPPMPEVEKIVAIPAKADETNKVPQARPPSVSPPVAGGRYRGGAWQGPTFPQELVGEETRSAEETQSPPLDSEPWGIRRILIVSLAGLWAGGVLLLLVRWLAGLVFLGRLRRAALPVQGAAAQIFQACRQELRLHRWVILATHSAVHSPITLGLFRPTILVPADWPNQTEATQSGALLHELAHLARYDDWSALLLELTRVLFFFHPLVYWLLARLERERELLCDEAAVSRGIDRQDYARMLLEFSRQTGRLRPAVLISPSYPIRFGSRRTVKIRIHQLLEETMHSLKSPLSTRRAVVLAAAILTLALGLGSFQVRAIETGEPESPGSGPQTPDQNSNKAGKPTVDKPSSKAEPDEKESLKEILRYGGKTFAEWRSELLTELKPEVRIEGVKALSAFGANGYADEAATAIVEMMRGYDISLGNPDDEKLIGESFTAILKIGPEAIPALLAELKGGKRNGRRFAIMTIERMRPETKSLLPILIASIKDEDRMVRRSAIEVLGSPKPEAKEHIAALIEALKDQDYGTRLAAVNALAGMGPNPNSVRGLIEALKDESEHIRRIAAEQLGAFGIKAKSAVSALVIALKDNHANVRSQAIEALAAVGPDAKSTVPALIDALKDQNDQVWYGSASLLGRFGPEAKEAVPALIKELKNDNVQRRAYAARILGQIGPAAKDAVPNITELLGNEDATLRKEARQALGKIAK